MKGSWFYAEVSPISRGNGGGSAVAAIAYRTAERLVDERTGEIHDYRRKRGVLSSFIVLPDGAPRWDRSELWNAAERRETRCNSVTARDLKIALPCEVSHEVRERISRGVSRFVAERYGAAAECALHAPSAKGDDRNYHAHILFTTRRLGAEGLGEKTRELDSRKKLADGRQEGAAEIEAIRAEVARLINLELERAGIDYRVDHRSYKRRGIDREAQFHMGNKASAMERKGKRTRIGNQNRAIRERNAERETLKGERVEIEAALQKAKAAEEAKEQARQKERANFETMASLRRARLQDAQFEARAILSERQQNERLKEEKLIHEHYRKGQEAQRARLQEIQANQSKGGVLYRMTRAQAERAEAQEIQLSLANGEQRAQEREGALALNHEREWKRQAEAEQRQTQALEGRIKQEREQKEREGWNPPTRETANDRQRGQPEGRDQGYERGR